MSSNKPKREKKKPKQLREAEKAHDAGIYSEGYRHGYQMGLEEGKRQALKMASKES
ncbi:hypothetical protein ACFPES_03385 [Paenibacillus sp. GCM10023248]|uniref:hypothetical protein n=1 Tax=unclassified Paenibacillus TaxID=185978 RepID=UPI002379911B|nr:hypothetical protein [Paenibacillus sp. MAHUQ-63]MDD9266068.1 hypothetical protein [Paenibacillus sp. MAHUQ-63]